MGGTVKGTQLNICKREREIGRKKEEVIRSFSLLGALPLHSSHPNRCQESGNLPSGAFSPSPKADRTFISIPVPPPLHRRLHDSHLAAVGPARPACLVASPGTSGRRQTDHNAFYGLAYPCWLAGREGGREGGIGRQSRSNSSLSLRTFAGSRFFSPSSFTQGASAPPARQSAHSPSLPLVLGHYLLVATIFPGGPLRAATLFVLPNSAPSSPPLCLHYRSIT